MMVRRGATMAAIPRTAGRRLGVKQKAALLVSVLLASLAADAQPVAGARRIGFLAGGSGSAAEGPRLTGAFRQRLGELGWVEGRNLAIEYRFAEGQIDKLPDLAAELVRSGVELIVAVPTPAAIAAKNATASVPVVMTSVGDPIGLGLVESLARPGGNVTGLSYTVGSDMVGKQLQLLREAVPKIKRVAILSNPANPSHGRIVGNVQTAATSLAISPQLFEARDPREFAATFAAMAKEHAQAIFVMQDSMFTIHRTQLAELAVKYRLPSMFGLGASVEAGGLMSYGPNLADQLRQAAVYVDKILKGARPAGLPVEQPTTFELIINLNTAKALGLVIPQSLRLRADQVIE